MTEQFLTALKEWVSMLNAMEKRLPDMQDSQWPYLGEIPVMYESEQVGVLADLTGDGLWGYVPTPPVQVIRTGETA